MTTNADINLGAESAIKDVRQFLQDKHYMLAEDLDNILKEVEWKAHNGFYEVRKELL